MHVRLGSNTAEFEGVALGDRRLDRRLLAIVERVAASPEASFPKLVASEGEREALYRFTGNERVDWRDVLLPHVQATVERCRAAQIVRVAHDTTFLSYDGEREGLGPIAGNKRGFGAHVSLAVTGEETRIPLGALGILPFVREDKPRVRTARERSQRVRENREKPRSEKESSRWLAQALATQERLGAAVSCIHVMDQEADDYALLADLVDHGMRFVVRGSADRRIDNRGEKLSERLSSATTAVFRTVTLSARKKPSPGHKARTERTATLHIKAMRISLRRPQYAQHDNNELHLNVVQVYEPEPPPGQPPVEWTLYTTECIETPQDLAAVVDHYRARWRIEEYFKALKSGCSIEKRQLETYDALLRALAIFAPVAWRLLTLRTLARNDNGRPAAELFDDIQLTVMNTLAKNRRLPPNPTVRDAYLVIADIGGHIKNNGEPGWIVLGRGFDDFIRADYVWRAALASAKK